MLSAIRRRIGMSASANNVDGQPVPIAGDLQEVTPVAIDGGEPVPEPIQAPPGLEHPGTPVGPIARPVQPAAVQQISNFQLALTGRSQVAPAERGGGQMASPDEHTSDLAPWAAAIIDHIEANQAAARVAERSGVADAQSSASDAQYGWWRGGHGWASGSDWSQSRRADGDGWSNWGSWDGP
jgi:hypothetical protein